MSENTVKDIADLRTAPNRSLSDQAYEAVLAMIADGECGVGSKLPTEHTLSERLRISRPILRRALKQLREDGVISSRQGSGSYVLCRPEGIVLKLAPIESIADIQRTFEFRAAVEGEAAYLAALRRTDADIDRMKTALDHLDDCIRTSKLGVDADEAFHEAVCAASGNKYFATARISMKSNILTGMNLTRSLSLSKTQTRLKLVQKEHYRIFDALVAGDADLARDTMRGHVTNAKRRIFEGTDQ